MAPVVANIVAVQSPRWADMSDDDDVNTEFHFSSAGSGVSSSGVADAVPCLFPAGSDVSSSGVADAVPCLSPAGSGVFSSGVADAGSGVSSSSVADAKSALIASILEQDVLKKSSPEFRLNVVYMKSMATKETKTIMFKRGDTTMYLKKQLAVKIYGNADNVELIFWGNPIVGDKDLVKCNVKHESTIYWKEAPSLHVVVKAENGKELKFDVEPSIQVEFVKKNIEKLTGLSRRCFKLTCGNWAMMEEKRIGWYAIGKPTVEIKLLLTNCLFWRCWRC